MLETSHDGQWALLRRGREVTLYAATATAPTAALTLAADDDAFVLVGPPLAAVRVSRAHPPAATRIELLAVPELAVVAGIELEVSCTLAATTGPRCVLVGPDAQGARTQVAILRTAGRGMSLQALSTQGVPVEHALGLGNDQVLLVLRKGTQVVHDAVSSRPVGRTNLPLPPSPVLGTALGHAWATQPSSDEVFLYRLSDGRPFRHSAGSTIEAVISHPASPVIVLVTRRQLVRLHCQAHSLSPIAAPYEAGTDLALIPGPPSAIEDVQLLGIPPGHTTPWRVSLGKPR